MWVSCAGAVVDCVPVPPETTSGDLYLRGTGLAQASAREALMRALLDCRPPVLVLPQ